MEASARVRELVVIPQNTAPARFRFLSLDHSGRQPPLELSLLPPNLAGVCHVGRVGPACPLPFSRAVASASPAFASQTRFAFRHVAATQPTIGGDFMLHARSLNSTLDRMMSLNRVLDQAMNGSWPTESASRVWVPALDIVEKRDAYVVVAELPGVSQNNVELSFEQNVLTIRGQKNPSLDPSQDGELRVYTAERVSGAFERAIRLPEFVDSEKIGAELRDGLLTITVPKATAAQPRKIEIKPVTQAHELKA